MGKMPFENFDFTRFFDNGGYALKEYVSEQPTDILITKKEKELGYKQPKSCIFLMEQHNGEPASGVELFFGLRRNQCRQVP